MTQLRIATVPFVPVTFSHSGWKPSSIGNRTSLPRFNCFRLIVVPNRVGPAPFAPAPCRAVVTSKTLPFADIDSTITDRSRGLGRSLGSVRELGRRLLKLARQQP